MNANDNVLIIGTGLAGVEVAFGLRANGWTGGIQLVGDTKVTPHHLPPLSKAYLAGTATSESLYLRTPEAYTAQNIQLLSGRKAMSIDRKKQQVNLADGQILGYDHLVLATGGRPRPLPVASDAADTARNFCYLRTLEDAESIRQQLIRNNYLVIIGGGYVGLEVAAAAIKAGMHVTLLDTADRLLARVTAPLVSDFYQRLHSVAGVKIRTDVQISRLELSEDQQTVAAILCEDGTRLPADLFITGIGLIPNCELASAAGLQVDNGILVNEKMQTSDHAIMAVGDCARFYSRLYERWVRIESVPNALEQARRISALLCDKPPREEAAPWFWSDQYDVGLKMVGLSDGYDRVIIRGTMDKPDFSVFYLLEERVLAVDTVNRPVEFNLAKKIITERLPVDPNLLEDENIPLKDIITAAKADLIKV